ncbi:DinB family protein [Streptomyces violaceorubidus]
MTTERQEPATDADERTMLEGWLEYHRQTLAWKCEGLTDEQLRTAAWHRRRCP